MQKHSEAHILISYLPHAEAVPKLFFEHYMKLWNIDKEPYRALSNCEDPAYWETFEVLLKRATLSDPWGNTWGLYYDGDLYAVPLEEVAHENRNHH